MVRRIARPAGARTRTWSRAEFLHLTTAAAAAWVAGWRTPRTADAQAPGDRATRIGRVIEEYDLQGIHRTGTEVDRRSAEWLRDEAARAGSDVRLESFTLDRVDPGVCRIEIDGRTIDGLPLFDGTFTDASGIRGRLGAPGGSAEILLVTAAAANISSEGRSLADLRRTGPHQAIVVVTNGAHPGLSPMNAALFTAPYGVPVLQVASEYGAWLDERARTGAPLRFIAHATRTRTDAFNVVASVPGRNASLPPSLVITPRSGWWHCASERGGGLACWLEAIRAASEAQAPRTALFLASSGHELGHLGLDGFIEEQKHLVRGAAAWLHLGANIGAAGGRARLQSSDDAIEATAAAAFESAGAPIAQRVPRGTVPAGEARNIHVGGGRYVSLLGSSPYFHSPADRWPAAVDRTVVERFATGVVSLLTDLLA